MTQEDIATLFDNNKGRYYTLDEMRIIFKERMNIYNVSKCVHKLLRREEYIARVRFTKKRTSHILLEYGHKEE